MSNSFDLRAWYERNVLVIIGLILMVTMASLLVGVAGVWLDHKRSLRDDADNAARDARTAAVTQCLREFAAATGLSNQEVRDATVTKDAADTAFIYFLDAEGLAFRRLLGQVLTGTATRADFRALYRALDARAAAGGRLEEAQRDLEQVRADNPVPQSADYCNNLAEEG